nr:hypothetical protein [uncultured bacterium]
MAGLRTVVPDALPLLGGEAVGVPLAALAATLVASLLVGLWLSRAQSGGRLPAGAPSFAARLRAAGEHAHGREAA